MSAQISNDEFQFYKTNLTKQVKEYLEIDDQIAALNKAIKDYKPDQVALESAFYGKSVKAAIKIGEARGVAILCAALADIPLFEYAPTEVKRAVVGIGNAQKVQVSKMVKILLALSEVPEKYDATDALAIAICHCHRMKLTI